MTKLHDQTTHDHNAEYLTRMQKDLGHHSWWYTNRQSADCINVKMHCWVDTDKVLAGLTEREREAVTVLDIDVDQFCDELKWRDIESTREWLLESLKDDDTLQNETAQVDSLDYGGRSGGWLAVVFDFDAIGDYLEGYDYAIEYLTKKEQREQCKAVDNAIAYIDKVHARIVDMHKRYCDELEKPEFYIEELQMHIEESIDHEQTKIEVATNKLKTLAK